MSWLGESEFECPECNGSKEIECFNCGSECECEECLGTGWDRNRIDVKAFKEANYSLNKACGDAGLTCGSWEWIEGDKRIGRMSKIGCIRATDFALNESERTVRDDSIALRTK